MPRKKSIPTETETIPSGSEAEAAAAPKAARPRARSTAGVVKSAAARPRKPKSMASAPALAVESIELPKPLDPIDEILKSAVSEREQVSLLAYRFWEERGRESGSAHEDWLRAEQVLRARRSQLVRSG